MGRAGANGRTRLPECGFTLDGKSCRKRGNHFCRQRAAHAVAFCAELCVHTKDKWARRPFVLSTWQRSDIIEPLFGEVTWDPEWESYVRRYQIGWIELARKNGKSELLAFIALYLLVGDDVEGAEIYGCAMDRGQAAKVFDVAARMVKLSPVLSARLVVKDHIKRIIDERTGSYYEVVAADAAGNLGHNPHGVVFDEVLTQRDARLWDAMRTGMGTRMQPLMVAATTAGDDPASFARSEHNECVRIMDDPDRARHRFAYVRNVPEDADPWDERNWPKANPALGDFLSIRSLRQEAEEAKNDPSKENAFRQYRLNQWVQQAHRWMPMPCTGIARARSPRPRTGCAPSWPAAGLTAVSTSPPSST
ncbi:terminase large subunit domain-containing protein [Saccharopolyspora phatthalungensis]|uniref:Phage terminase large subunit-like protein n=1 Tax=Saccharopolyspora phatthalungensis TaxID=664693 RepID=A0A840Q5K0_9PSEU|nr:terminase large subunit [Saccharopolyspora phatthalungensis]MBB5154971.1 phage terminase large subunit-like protein [Saccharopolyspora phatthalungensis]